MVFPCRAGIESTHPPHPKENPTMFAILMAACLAGDVVVEPKSEPIKGQAPMLLTVQVKDDQLVSKRTVMEYITQKRVEEVNVNGRVEKREVAVVVPVMKELMMAWDLKKATATAGGKKISADDLKKQLAKPTLVVVSSDGKEVDAAYLKLFAKETIVI